MSPLSAVLVLVAALAGAALALWGRRQLHAIAIRRRFRIGARGEARAERLLPRLGYRIVEVQPRRVSRIWIDGEELEVEVRADYLVAKGRRTFVVEVKTGKSATDPASRSTRRQLLEYERVYDVDGILLADMEAGRLHEVRFPARRDRVAQNTAVLLLAALALGLVIGGWSTRAYFGP